MSASKTNRYKSPYAVFDLLKCKDYFKYFF